MNASHVMYTTIRTQGVMQLTKCISKMINYLTTECRQKCYCPFWSVGVFCPDSRALQSVDTAAILIDDNSHCKVKK